MTQINFPIYSSVTVYTRLLGKCSWEAKEVPNTMWHIWRPCWGAGSLCYSFRAAMGQKRNISNSRAFVWNTPYSFLVVGVWKEKRKTKYRISGNFGRHYFWRFGSKPSIEKWPSLADQGRQMLVNAGIQFGGSSLDCQTAKFDSLPIFPLIQQKSLHSIF